jgi:hypothetical protein
VWGAKEARHGNRAGLADADALPKTRSVKIMTRILRKVAAGDTVNMGGLRTVSDKTGFERLIQEREVRTVVSSFHCEVGMF